MKKLRVNVAQGYDILIGKGLLNDFVGYVDDICKAKKVCLISETNVYPLYGQDIHNQLENSGYKVFDFVFPAGEESKKPQTVIEMVEFMAENELTRNDIAIALGGGVCGDMAGFAAAIYLRGIKFVQIPTSLLAQVDSSVGGKTAVDLPQGKNICGAFHQPSLVLIDPNTLDTLSDHFFADGMAEAIKMGCIKSESLFELIEQNDVTENIEDIIYQCVSLKAGVVERDEKEHGERALLNFGHTPGHAIEKLHNFKTVSHGEAVGMGMVLISSVGENLGITPKGTSKRIADILIKNNLQTQDNHSVKEIVSAMSADKKRTGEGINFIMLHSVGNGFIYPVENENIPKMFGVE